MSTPVKLPELGESVTEGTITRWLKQVGDTVEVDEPLLEVSTDKVDTEVPSPVAGKILEIKAEEDETVEVGAELCIIGDEGEDAGSTTPRTRRTPRTREERRGLCRTPTTPRTRTRTRTPDDAEDETTPRTRTPTTTPTRRPTRSPSRSRRRRSLPPRRTAAGAVAAASR